MPRRPPAVHRHRHRAVTVASCTPHTRYSSYTVLCVLLVGCVLLPVSVDAFCSGTVTFASTGEKSGEITNTDPNVNTYQNDGYCVWKIYAPTDERVVLEFTAFDMHSGGDYLYVYEGEDVSSSGALLATYTGDTIPEYLVSSGNELSLLFVSDASFMRQGFTLTFRHQGSYCSASPDAPLTLTGLYTDLVSTPSPFSGFYAGNSTCGWEMTVPTGVAILDFEAFNTDPNDVLTVYDGSIAAGTLLGTHSGSSLPPSYTASGDTISLVFATDNKTETTGFAARYVSSDVEYCAPHTVVDTSSGSGSLTNTDPLVGGYQNNGNCTWVLDVSDRPSAVGVVIEFTSLDLEADVDVVELISSDGAVAATVSGSSPPAAIEINSLVVRVRFSSDSATTGVGFSLNWEVQGAHCAGTAYPSGSVGNISDPAPWTGLYAASSTCRWRLSASHPAAFYQFTLVGIDTESGSDVVTIYDGDSNSDAVLAAWSGSSMPSEPAVNSTASSILISFITNSAVQGRGFRIDYAEQPPVTLLERQCSGTTAVTPANSGSFSNPSPLFGLYVDDATCVWTVSVVSADRRLRLDWAFIDLEYNDYVVIYNGGSTSGTLLARVTGQTDPGAVVATAGSATIKFVSDSADARQGFELDWSRWSVATCGDGVVDDDESCEGGSGSGCDASTCTCVEGWQKSTVAQGCTGQDGPFVTLDYVSPDSATRDAASEADKLVDVIAEVVRVSPSSRVVVSSVVPMNDTSGVDVSAGESAWTARLNIVGSDAASGLHDTDLFLSLVSSGSPDFALGGVRILSLASPLQTAEAGESECQLPPSTASKLESDESELRELLNLDTVSGTKKGDGELTTLASGNRIPPGAVGTPTRIRTWFTAVYRTNTEVTIKATHKGGDGPVLLLARWHEAPTLESTAVALPGVGGGSGGGCSYDVRVETAAVKADASALLYPGNKTKLEFTLKDSTIEEGYLYISIAAGEGWHTATGPVPANTDTFEGLEIGAAVGFLVSIDDPTAVSLDVALFVLFSLLVVSLALIIRGCSPSFWATLSSLIWRPTDEMQSIIETKLNDERERAARARTGVERRAAWKQLHSGAEALVSAGPMYEAVIALLKKYEDQLIESGNHCDPEFPVGAASGEDSMEGSNDSVRDGNPRSLRAILRTLRTIAVQANLPPLDINVHLREHFGDGTLIRAAGLYGDDDSLSSSYASEYETESGTSGNGGLRPPSFGGSSASGDYSHASGADLFGEQQEEEESGVVGSESGSEGECVDLDGVVGESPVRTSAALLGDDSAMSDTSGLDYSVGGAGSVGGIGSESECECESESEYDDYTADGMDEFSELSELSDDDVWEGAGESEGSTNNNRSSYGGNYTDSDMAACEADAYEQHLTSLILQHRTPNRRPDETAHSTVPSGSESESGSEGDMSATEQEESESVARSGTPRKNAFGSSSGYSDYTDSDPMASPRRNGAANVSSFFHSPSITAKKGGEPGMSSFTSLEKFNFFDDSESIVGEDPWDRLERVGASTRKVCMEATRVTELAMSMLGKTLREIDVNRKRTSLKLEQVGRQLRRVIARASRECKEAHAELRPAVHLAVEAAGYPSAAQTGRIVRHYETTLKWYIALIETIVKGADTIGLATEPTPTRLRGLVNGDVVLLEIEDVAHSLVDVHLTNFNARERLEEWINDEDASDGGDKKRAKGGTVRYLKKLAVDLNRRATRLEGETKRGVVYMAKLEAAFASEETVLERAREAALAAAALSPIIDDVRAGVQSSKPEACAPAIHSLFGVRSSVFNSSLYLSAAVDTVFHDVRDIANDIEHLYVDPTRAVLAAHLCELVTGLRRQAEWFQDSIKNARKDLKTAARRRKKNAPVAETIEVQVAGRPGDVVRRRIEWVVKTINRASAHIDLLELSKKSVVLRRIMSRVASIPLNTFAVPEVLDKLVHSIKAMDEAGYGVREPQVPLEVTIPQLLDTLSEVRLQAAHQPACLLDLSPLPSGLSEQSKFYGVPVVLVYIISCLGAVAFRALAVFFDLCRASVSMGLLFYAFDSVYPGVLERVGGSESESESGSGGRWGGVAFMAGLFDATIGFMDGLNIVAAVRSGLYNCGGALYSVAPIAVVLLGAVALTVFRMDVFLVGVLARNRAHHLTNPLRYLCNRTADLAAACLVLFSQVVVMTFGANVITSVFNFDRSCSAFDKGVVDSGGPVYVYVTSTLFAVILLVYFAGPPSGLPPCGFLLSPIATRTVDRGTLPLFLRPVYALWLLGHALCRTLLTILGVWTEGMLVSQRVLYRAAKVHTHPSDHNEHQETVLRLTSAGHGLVWLLFPLGVFVCKAQEALNTAIIFAKPATPYQRLQPLENGGGGGGGGDGVDGGNTTRTRGRASGKSGMENSLSEIAESRPTTPKTERSLDAILPPMFAGSSVTVTDSAFGSKSRPTTAGRSSEMIALSNPISPSRAKRKGRKTAPTQSSCGCGYDSTGIDEDAIDFVVPLPLRVFRWTLAVTKYILMVAFATSTGVAGTQASGGLVGLIVVAFVEWVVESVLDCAAAVREVGFIDAVGNYNDL